MFEKLEELAKNNKKISDFHLRAGSPLAYRQTGEIVMVQEVLIKHQDLKDLLSMNCNERELEKEAYKFKSFIESSVEGKVLGPVNAPIFRLKRKFRIRLLIRGRKSLNMQNSLAKMIQKFKFPTGMKLTVDVDPINFN